MPATLTLMQILDTCTLHYEQKGACNTDARANLGHVVKGGL